MMINDNLVISPAISNVYTSCIIVPANVMGYK